MTEFNPYPRIIRPLMTERSTAAKEKFNQYAFEVLPSATKPEIKRAVQEIFKVKVLSVRTMNVEGSFRRFGRGGGKRPDWKKAIVTVQAGQRIDLVEQSA